VVEGSFSIPMSVGASEGEGEGEGCLRDRRNRSLKDLRQLEFHTTNAHVISATQDRHHQLHIHSWRLSTASHCMVNRTIEEHRNTEAGYTTRWGNN